MITDCDEFRTRWRQNMVDKERDEFRTRWRQKVMDIERTGF